MLFVSSKKLLLFFKIFKFLPCLLGHTEKKLDWKEKVNFKIYDVTTWLTNILLNISRSKSNNHAIKFGQLIECSKRNVFLRKSC